MVPVMQTLTVTTARQNLRNWLERAVAGEEIGVIVGDKIVALRPVPVTAADYAQQEYGLTAAEVDAAAARIEGETRAAAAAGSVVDYRPGMLRRENPAHKTLPRLRKKTRRH